MALDRAEIGEIARRKSVLRAPEGPRTVIAGAGGQVERSRATPGPRRPRTASIARSARRRSPAIAVPDQ